MLVAVGDDSLVIMVTGLLRIVLDNHSNTAEYLEMIGNDSDQEAVLAVVVMILVVVVDLTRVLRRLMVVDVVVHSLMASVPMRI